MPCWHMEMEAKFYNTVGVSIIKIHTYIHNSHELDAERGHIIWVSLFHCSLDVWVYRYIR